MRRTLLFSAVIGVFAAGVGCKHVGGRCDCTHNPADAVMPTPGVAYPTIGAPTVGVTPLPTTATAAMAPNAVPVPKVADPVAPAVTPEKLPMPK